MIVDSLRESSHFVFRTLLLLLLVRAGLVSAITNNEATIFAGTVCAFFVLVSVVLLLVLMYVLRCHKCVIQRRSKKFPVTKSGPDTPLSSNVQIFLQKRRKEKENGGQDMADHSGKKDAVAETSFAERKVVAQEKINSQNRLQRESETPLMEDEIKRASPSSGEEGATNEKDKHASIPLYEEMFGDKDANLKEAYASIPVYDEVFDNKDDDLKEDHMSFEERKHSAIFNRQESSDVRKDSLAPLTIHEVIMCVDELPQEDRSSSPTEPTLTKQDPSPARVDIPLQSTPRPGSQRQSVHSLLDRSDSFTGAVDTPTRIGSSSMSRKTSMILASAAAKLMDAERSPAPLRSSASVEADVALKDISRSSLPLRTCSSVETDTPLKYHSPSANNASQVSNPGDSSPVLHMTSGSSIGWSNVSQTMNYMRKEVEDTVRRYSQTEPRSGSLSFTVPASGTASRSNGGTPTKKRLNVATKLTFMTDMTDVGISGREFNTLPSRKSGTSQQGGGSPSLKEERKRMDYSVQELSHDKDRRRSAAATFGHNRNSSGTFL